MGLGLDAVFVVPGNHDVQRPVDKLAVAEMMLRRLREGNTSLDEALAEPEGFVALTEARWKLTMSRLRKVGLLAAAGKTDGSLDAHPLVRACFGEMLARENPEGFRVAHGRLYAYLRDKDTTPNRPGTLEELQPLYQAVWHGCRAGQHQEALERVFYERIQRADKHYSALNLGAFGADLATLAGFFEEAWTRPAASLTENAQAWVLAEAAFALHAL